MQIRERILRNIFLTLIVRQQKENFSMAEVHQISRRIICSGQIGWKDMNRIKLRIRKFEMSSFQLCRLIDPL